MRRWLVLRLLQALLTLLLAIVLLFLLTHILPGDPLAREGSSMALTPAQRAALTARYGLDRPLHAQLASFLSGLARGVEVGADAGGHGGGGARGGGQGLSGSQ